MKYLKNINFIIMSIAMLSACGTEEEIKFSPKIGKNQTYIITEYNFSNESRIISKKLRELTYTVDNKSFLGSYTFNVHFDYLDIDGFESFSRKEYSKTSKGALFTPGFKVIFDKSNNIEDLHGNNTDLWDYYTKIKSTGSEGKGLASVYTRDH